MAETLQVRNNEAEHRFEIELDGDVAFAEYRLAEGIVILPHTVVPEAFEGRGVGSTLAKAALQFVRDRGSKLVPTCPFIAAYVAKHPEWHDVVHETYRAQLGIRG
jgi:predicted GNAT family acetyltransferase